jgi:hypothetical protein
VLSNERVRMLVYAGVCVCMLVYAGVCVCMLVYAGVRWCMMCGYVCLRMLAFAYGQSHV